MLVNELKPLGCGVAPGPDMDVYKLLSSLTWHVCRLFKHVTSVIGASIALGPSPALCAVGCPLPALLPPPRHAWTCGMCIKLYALQKRCSTSLL